MTRIIPLTIYGQSISGIKIAIGASINWQLTCVQPDDPSTALNLTGLTIKSSLCAIDMQRRPIEPPAIGKTGTIINAVTGRVDVNWLPADTVPSSGPLDLGSYLMDVWISDGASGRVIFATIAVELIAAATLPS